MLKVQNLIGLTITASPARDEILAANYQSKYNMRKSHRDGILQSLSVAPKRSSVRDDLVMVWFSINMLLLWSND